MTRKLLKYPAESLKKESSPVNNPAEWKQLVKNMKNIISEHEGVGLAAPQVGENIRLFVMRVQVEGEKFEAYFNPRILDREDNRPMEESCLSFPDISVVVDRYRRVTFKALSVDGKPVEKTVNDLQAQAVQHEIDHLDGITLVDRCGLRDKMVIDEKIKETAGVGK